MWIFGPLTLPTEPAPSRIDVLQNIHTTHCLQAGLCQHAGACLLQEHLIEGSMPAEHHWDNSEGELPCRQAICSTLCQCAGASCQATDILNSYTHAWNNRRTVRMAELQKQLESIPDSCPKKFNGMQFFNPEF